jgi:vanillate/3-O-methylgallate O-demethylase
MTDATFTAPLAMPFYTDHVLYHALDRGSGIPPVRAWQFNGWKAESMSWKTGCYIHAGLSSTGPISFKGPDAEKFLESICINSFARFPVGSMKHAVMCNEDGVIAAHGITERRAEDEFCFFAGGPWPMQKLAETSYNVEAQMRNEYLFQIAGPTSLKTLEKVTGESLRDIGFLRFRESSIDGTKVEVARDSSIDGTKVEVARIGMSGNLAYELHGPIEDGPTIYEAVYRAGQEFGIERLGWGTYLVNHVEGGFPQGTWTFVPAQPIPDDMASAAVGRFYKVSGSVDPANMRARYRTPIEVGWHGMCKFDHDFIGRAALEAEVANPKRTVVTLRWSPEDVIDIYASLLRPGEEYKTIDLPYAPHVWPQAHADHILKDGRQVGISSGTIYSYFFREVLSMGCIDLDASEIGTDVSVQWGDHGGRIKDVRATVARFPYLTEGRNSDLDVATIR